MHHFKFIEKQCQSSKRSTRQEQIITSLLQKKANVSTGGRNGQQKKVELSVSTKGKKLKVLLNPKLDVRPVFSKESLDNLQIGLGVVSDLKMKKITNWIRAHAGKKLISPYYRQHLSNQGKLLEDCYNLTYHMFTPIGLEEKKVLRPVVWGNAEELLNAVSSQRGYLGSVFVKVMADGGQKFFKICATIPPENNRDFTDEEMYAAEHDGTDPPEKKTLFVCKGWKFRKKQVD